jgi:hypothetical protein
MGSVGVNTQSPQTTGQFVGAGLLHVSALPLGLSPIFLDISSSAFVLDEFACRGEDMQILVAPA